MSQLHTRKWTGKGGKQDIQAYKFGVASPKAVG